MEIIKHGNSWTECKCDNCLCEFNYLPKDIKYESHHDILYTSYYIRTYVVCPECGHEIIKLKNF